MHVSYTCVSCNTKMNIRRPYKIDIPNHCSEKWKRMKDLGEDKGCLVCKKTVYDFTTKTDIQIHKLLKSNKEEIVCGRFSSSQLNRALKITPSIFNKSIRLLLPTIFIVGINDANAINLKPKKNETYITQSIIKTDSTTISGQIVDSETKEPLMFANVFFKGTKKGISTDENGKFILIVTSKTLSTNDSLICNYIGYKEKVIKIEHSAISNLVIEMKSDAVFIGSIIIKKEPLFRRIFKRKKSS
jgi:hypothetical protein